MKYSTEMRPAARLKATVSSAELGKESGSRERMMPPKPTTVMILNTRDARASTEPLSGPSTGITTSGAGCGRSIQLMSPAP
jgi:hypothetical protein